MILTCPNNEHDLFYKDIKTPIEFGKVHRDRGQWSIYYTSPKNFIIMFSYSLAYQLWGLLLNFGCFFIKCSNPNLNLQKRYFCVSAFGMYTNYFPFVNRKELCSHNPIPHIPAKLLIFLQLEFPSEFHQLRIKEKEMGFTSGREGCHEH